MCGPWISPLHSPPGLTCPNEVAGLVHLALEELQSNDGIDDDHEEDKQGNMEQGKHGLEDGVEDHLQACHSGQEKEGGVTPCLGLMALSFSKPWEAYRTPCWRGVAQGKGEGWEGRKGSAAALPPTGHPRHQPEGSEHAEGSQGLDVQASSFAAQRGRVALDDINLFQNRCEDPGVEMMERRFQWSVNQWSQ